MQNVAEKYQFTLQNKKQMKLIYCLLSQEVAKQESCFAVCCMRISNEVLTCLSPKLLSDKKGTIIKVL